MLKPKVVKPAGAESVAERAARKKQFDEAIRGVLERIQRPKVRSIRGLPCSTGGAKLLPLGSSVAPRAEQERVAARMSATPGTINLIYRRVAWKLKHGGVSWPKMRDDLARESFRRIAVALIRNANRAAGYDDQIPLPGFEGLPSHIRFGRESLPIARMAPARYLAYVEHYEQRYDKDRRKAEELRRLADRIKPFVEKASDVEAALALALAAESPARLRVVSG